MAYVVVHPFHDLEDFIVTKSGKIYHHYEIGDIYPRPGKDTMEARCAYLAGTENPMRVPLIQATEEEPVPEADFAAPEPEPEVSEGDQVEMVTEEAKKPKRAKTAASKKA